MRRLNGRDDALGLGEQLEGVHRFDVGDRFVGGAPGIRQPSMLWANPRIVKARGNGVRFDRLAILVLQNVGAGAVQHAWRPGADGGGVAARLDAVSPGLNTQQGDVIVDEIVELPDGVGSATHARDDVGGQAAEPFQHLRPRFGRNDALELPHHGGERMRPADGADEVMGVVDGGHPVAHGFVHGVFQCARPSGHGYHLGAEQLHARDVEGLALRVHLAHVDTAFQPEERSGGGRRDSMLPSASFSNDAALAHAFREQRLPQHVVDLVRARVVEVFALEVHFGVAGVFGEALGEGHRCWAAGVVALEPTKLLTEAGVGLRVGEGLLQFQ